MQIDFNRLKCYVSMMELDVGGFIELPKGIVTPQFKKGFYQYLKTRGYRRKYRYICNRVMRVI